MSEPSYQLPGLLTHRVLRKHHRAIRKGGFCGFSKGVAAQRRRKGVFCETNRSCRGRRPAGM